MLGMGKRVWCALYTFGDQVTCSVELGDVLCGEPLSQAVLGSIRREDDRERKLLIVFCHTVHTLVGRSGRERERGVGDGRGGRIESVVRTRFCGILLVSNGGLMPTASTICLILSALKSMNIRVSLSVCTHIHTCVCVCVCVYTCI